MDFYFDSPQHSTQKMHGYGRPSTLPRKPKLRVATCWQYPSRMDELIFVVTPDPDGGFTAAAVGAGIFT